MENNNEKSLANYYALIAQKLTDDMVAEITRLRQTVIKMLQTLDGESATVNCYLKFEKSYIVEGSDTDETQMDTNLCMVGVHLQRNTVKTLVEVSDMESEAPFSELVNWQLIAIIAELEHAVENFKNASFDYE